MDSSLAARITYLCESSGVKSREALSLACGLSAGHLGLFARGAYPSMTTTVASKIASTFGCSLDWLIAGKGTRPPAARVRAAVAKAREDQGPDPKAA